MVTTRNKPLAFLVRFVAFSSVLFFIWFYLDNIYVSMTGYMTEILLNCMVYHIHLAPDPNIALYLSTFNLIAFTALILATQHPSISRKDAKVKALVIGLTLMMLVEVIHGLHQILADFGVGYALEDERVRVMLEIHKSMDIVERLHLLVETVDRMRKKLEDMIKKKKER